MVATDKEFPKKNNLLNQTVIGLIASATRYLFHKVEFIFPGKPELQLNYPTVVIANHVDERDIPALALVHKYNINNVRYTVPVRHDILEDHFFVKEFRPKGIAKYILAFVDFTHVVPWMFRLVGAVGVKRPFRDNTRVMVKDGSFKDRVGEEWDELAKNIKLGRNLFLFPEGTFTQDGAMTSIRQGVYLLKERLDKFNLLALNLTYDFLSFEKPAIHIGVGNEFYLPDNATKDEVAQKQKEEIEKYLVITPANLFSWTLFTEEVKQGIGFSDYLNRIDKMISYCKEKKIYVAGSLNQKGEEVKKIFEKLIINATKEGFTTDIERFSATPKVFETPHERRANLRKSNPYYYHRNQLKSIIEELEMGWK